MIKILINPAKMNFLKLFIVFTLSIILDHQLIIAEWFRYNDLGLAFLQNFCHMSFRSLKSFQINFRQEEFNTKLLQNINLVVTRPGFAQVESYL